MEKDVLFQVLKEVLNHLSSFIVIKDENDKVVYQNSNLVDEIINKSQLENKIYDYIEKEILVNNHNYKLEMYIDRTDYVIAKQKSKQDYLTGLINRRTLDEECRKLVEEFEVKQTPFSIIMGDIDNFKKINDTYGHQIGDKILTIVSSILKKNIKKTDLVARYGGEEFLIVLKNCDIDIAYQIIERIRKEIENFSFINFGLNNITVSFGISLYDGSISIEDVIKGADNELYNSKRNGKNKTSVDINKKKKMIYKNKKK